MSPSGTGEACWCVGLPPLAQAEPGTSCLCPDCLRQSLAREGGAQNGLSGLC